MKSGVRSGLTTRNINVCYDANQSLKVWNDSCLALVRCNAGLRWKVAPEGVITASYRMIGGPGACEQVADHEAACASYPYDHRNNRDIAEIEFS